MSAVVVVVVVAVAMADVDISDDVYSPALGDDGGVCVCADVYVQSEQKFILNTHTVYMKVTFFSYLLFVPPSPFVQ